MTGRNGQSEARLQTGVGAEQLEPSAVQFRNAGNKAEPQTAAWFRPAGIKPYKTFDHPFALLFRNARSIVGDLDEYTVTVAPGGKPDRKRQARISLAIRHGVLESIVQEVCHRLGDELPVAVYVEFRLGGYC